MTRAVAAVLVVFAAVPAHAQSKAEVAQNQAAFRLKCASCHSVACNRVGPKLEGVIGRPAGSVPDYQYYSSALKDSGIVWTEDAIDAYVREPSKKIPGTAMTSPPMPDARERRAVLAHIRRQDKSIDLCN